MVSCSSNYYFYFLIMNSVLSNLDFRIEVDMMQSFHKILLSQLLISNKLLSDEYGLAMHQKQHMTYIDILLLLCWFQP